MSERLPIASVAIVSGAALANEILLTRYFAIVHWHHHAWMMISLALLGFGASGTFLVLAQPRLAGRYEPVFIASLVAFGAFALAGPLIATALPFQAEQLLWDTRQLLWLTLTYLALALPFFCAATAIALALARWQPRAGQVYGADLLGAGVGSLLVLSLLYVIPPESALRLIVLAGPLAALVALLELRRRSRLGWLAAAALLAILVVPTAWLRPEPGEYKPLRQALRIDATRIVAERWSPLGRVDVIESPRAPLRHAPGLSLMADREPPPQLGLFVDGEGMDAITAATGDPASLEFLAASTGALAYRIAQPRSVLVVGAGGGLEILRARFFGARRIEAVERNPQVVELLRHRFGGYTGGLVEAPGVELVVGDVRGVLATHARRYDLVLLPHTGAAGGGGLGGLGEDYVHTVQAFALYLSRLAPGGWLSVTRPAEVPPREALKLVATARAALASAGVADAAARLVMIRGWQAVTLLVKNGELTTEEIRRTLEFCETNAFDAAWYPGMPRELANRYNQLAQPWFHDGALALLGTGRERFTADYAFDIRPATDDRPYFNNHFRWQSFVEGWRGRDRGGLALVESGYAVLATTLVQALLAAALLILAPLAVLRHRDATTRGFGRVFAYFAALGLAFLFVEVVFIQKLMRFVHHPTIALAVALATFLVGAGVGSAWTARPGASAGVERSLALAVIGIVGLGFAHAVGFDPLFSRLDHWPVAPKAALAAASILPLAFVMGMPLPLALRRIDPPFVPWAWGINGCASVASPVLAVLIAVDLGYTVVLLLGLAIYACVPIAFPRAAALRV